MIAEVTVMHKLVVQLHETCSQEFNSVYKKGKAVPLQAWSGPEGSRKLRFPDFMTMAQDGGKVASLMHRPPLPPGNAPGTHFCCTALQVGRSQDRFPVSLGFFLWHLTVPCALESNSASKNEYWDNIGGKGGRCIRLTTYHLHVPIVKKSGGLNLLEPCGPVQACKLYLFTHFC